MSFNCSRCLSKCEAYCCGPVPMTPAFIEAHKVVRPIIKLIQLGDNLVIPETEDLRCPFLSADFKCTVYDDRPEVCKTFGDESAMLMTCPYQAADGRVRSRQERRSLERQTGKEIKRMTGKHTK